MCLLIYISIYVLDTSVLIKLVWNDGGLDRMEIMKMSILVLHLMKMGSLQSTFEHRSRLYRRSRWLWPSCMEGDRVYLIHIHPMAWYLVFHKDLEWLNNMWI